MREGWVGGKRMHKWGTERMGEGAAFTPPHQVGGRREKGNDGRD